MALTARETIERHAKGAIEGKLDVVIGDLMPELIPGIQPLAEKLGAIQPTGYKILNEKKKGDQVTYQVKYIGSEGSLIVQSTWESKGEDWKVVEAVVV